MDHSGCAPNLMEKLQKYLLTKKDDSVSDS